MQPATKRKLRNLSLIIIVCFILVNLGFGYPFHTRSLNSARDQNEIHSQGKSLEKYTEQDDQQLEIRRLLKIIDDLEKRKLRNKRLAIFTVHTPPYYSSWAKIAVNNHKTYADKYGYAHYVDHGKSDPRHSAWSKISSLLRHMEEDDHEWFWALDLDTLVMNGNILAEDLIDDDFDLVLNRDCNWFNAGSFLIKNSNWSRNFMKKGSKD